MSDAATRFHEQWLGMVQPLEGLVVSVPVLVDTQVLHRHPPEFQQNFVAFLEPTPETADGDAIDRHYRVRDTAEFLREFLEWPDAHVDAEVPEALSLYVPEGKQTITPSFALKRVSPRKEAAEDTPAAKAGAAYTALVWNVPDGLELDKPETATGPWEYPPSAKFDRLLRHCRVPIGLLTNQRVIRLVYAPHGESSGSITFRIDDMASVGGRPILDAFAGLLSGTRFFSVAAEHQLPAILEESRRRQINVTNKLADQVFEALQILLAGFEAAGDRDPAYRAVLDDALTRENDHLYGGLLTVLLRLVFVLYAEDRGLLPVDDEFYASNLSLLRLFDELQEDHGSYPDSMAQRFGAWSNLITLFRAVYLGCEHDELRMPPRRGELFDPHVHPFLEGWGPAGSAPISMAEQRAAVAVPGIDDGTVFDVLRRLLFLEGQRLSYRALDVEQIGSVYEALMGYHVHRVASPSVRLRADRAKAVWISATEALEVPKSRRAKWLQQDVGLTKAVATKVATALASAKDEGEVLEQLGTFKVKGSEIAAPGRLVLQPGSERKRTSSHYTPRSLSAPIVSRTLEPLIAAMGETPSSEDLLSLKICDPAMGSGAFLVETVRYLADQVIAAWTREDRLDKIADQHEGVVNHARRLVAQRCVYGVDKNPFAVNLAKLSLWLITLAKDEPFTFVDHALRHGDSLVGLDFDQITSFHWKPGPQLEVCRGALENALDEAISLRQEILDMADEMSSGASRDKERLLRDAEDALAPVRLIGDLIVGAFFSASSDKARQQERDRRLALVEAWLREGGEAPEELLALQAEIRETVATFHWMPEFPEVFYEGRVDPFSSEAGQTPAYLDAFVGNPPFLGGSMISTRLGDGYRDWLLRIHEKSHGNGDLVAHFFRRAALLLGEHGSVGFIATNTIAQGDTRATGVKYLLEQGAIVFDAQKNYRWPGDAAVSVSFVCMAFGSAVEALRGARLDGFPVGAVNSRLLGRPERPDPVPLGQNESMSFAGSKVYGKGFELNEQDVKELVTQSPRNGDRIFPYIGGQEVNVSPTQSYDRYVINFGQLSLQESGVWPDLLSIVRDRVKPERDRNKRDSYRVNWWLHGEKRPALYSAIRLLLRCLVNSQVSKHLIFAFQPTDRVFAHTLYVYPLPEYTHFAILQSRVHEPWARLLSSSMKNDLRYAASDCFDTFPFPKPDPKTVIPELEDIGERLYEARAAYMVANDVGLTITYNRLKDPECTEPDTERLRALHVDMDRAVLAAYGWEDIPVPTFHTPANSKEERALETFQDEVIDRLFVLNAERAEEERRKGLTGRGAKGKKGTSKGKTKSDAQLDLTTD